MYLLDITSGERKSFLFPVIKWENLKNVLFYRQQIAYIQTVRV